MSHNGTSRHSRYLDVRTKDDAAKKAQAHAGKLACEAWNARRTQLGGPLEPSPSLRAAINGGFPWLRVECNACQQHAWIDMRKIQRPLETPIWRLERWLSCDASRQGRRYGPRASIEMLCSHDKQLGPAPYQERD